MQIVHLVIFDQKRNQSIKSLQTLFLFRGKVHHLPKVSIWENVKKISFGASEESIVFPINFHCWAHVTTFAFCCLLTTKQCSISPLPKRPMTFLSLLEFCLKVKGGSLMLTGWQKYHIFIWYYCKDNKMVTFRKNFLFTGSNLFSSIQNHSTLNIEKKHFGWDMLLVSSRSIFHFLKK